jgi:hypothetical protein
MILVMYANPRMKYKSNLSRDKQGWIETYKGRRLLMKGCSILWNRPMALNLSNMTMSLEKTMNSRRNMVCFR